MTYGNCEQQQCFWKDYCVRKFKRNPIIKCEISQLQGFTVSRLICGVG